MGEHRSTLLSHSSSIATSRRTILGGAAAFTGAFLLARRAAAQSSEGAPIENPLLGTTFVGLASDGVTHVAVVQIIGAESAEVRCYLCDGLGRSDWLTGPMVDGPVPLTSGDVTVQLTFGESAVSGEATLGSAGTLSFEAVVATAPAGLYEIGPIDDHLLGGSSTAGAVVQLQVIGALPDGSWLLSGLAISPDEQALPLAFLASPDAGGELRIIVAPTGTAAGGPRIVQGISRGSGAVRTTIQMSAPASGTQWIDPEPTPWTDPNPEP